MTVVVVIVIVLLVGPSATAGNWADPSVIDAVSVQPVGPWRVTRLPPVDSATGRWRR